MIAPILAAVLGVTGGAVAATVTSGPDAASFADPLHLGVPLANVPCTGGYLLVVAHGEGGSSLGNGVADNRDAGVRYLQTSQSCRTRFGPDGDRNPSYVAYVGPYPTAVGPCTTRMTPDARSDLVVALDPGHTQPIKCPCVLKTDDAPTLTTATRTDAEANVWARSLQTMLRDYAISQGQSLTGPDAPPKVVGYYDELTRRYILTRFQTPAGYLGHNGLMDTETWAIVTRRICPIYDES